VQRAHRLTSALQEQEQERVRALQQLEQPRQPQAASALVQSQQWSLPAVFWLVALFLVLVAVVIPAAPHLKTKLRVEKEKRALRKEQARFFLGHFFPDCTALRAVGE